MADEFEMDDLSRLPPRPSKPQRPRSQMFEEPLHIQQGGDDPGMADGSMFGNIPNQDSIPGLGPPSAPMVNPQDLGMGGGGMGMGMGMGGMGGGMGMGMGGMGGGMGMGGMGGGMGMGGMGGGMGGMGGGMGMGGGYAAPSYPSGDDGGPLQKVIVGCSICIILFMCLLLILLNGVILWQVLGIQDDVENLTFKIKVPNTGPPPYRPQG